MSPAGKSMLCCSSGTVGRRDAGSSTAALRAALAAMRRCFLDFAGGRGLVGGEGKGDVRKWGRVYGGGDVRGWR